IQLLGLQNDEGKWAFRKNVNEMFDDLDEHSIQKDDHNKKEKVLDQSYSSFNNVVTEWEEALDLLNYYPWIQLYPKYVHRAFSHMVWKKVTDANLSRHQKDEWANVCFP
ncbi:hypothetical protein, partial [Pseudomonas sp. 2822-17]|uniref:hypothetical protein n=1 Tax=Pseudomonas sp. 2822-17 TaxID=1712678 RepID=UPI000C1513B3